MGFKGDGRGFDRNASANRSRVQVLITPGDHNVKLTASPSCNILFCHDPLSSNSVTVKEGDNGSFTVSVKATNSAALGLAPPIDATVTFSPDGNGGYKTSGNRDDMPSLGIYMSSGDGWNVLQERPEHGGALEGYYLYHWTKRDRW